METANLQMGASDVAGTPSDLETLRSIFKCDLDAVIAMVSPASEELGPSLPCAEIVCAAQQSDCGAPSLKRETATAVDGRFSMVDLRAAMLSAKPLIRERLMRPIAGMRERFRNMYDSETIDRFEATARGELELAIDEYEANIERILTQ